MSSTDLPPITAVLVRALNFSRWTGMLSRSASSSITRKPMLWRVHSYLGPGLPRPTTSHSTGPGRLEKNIEKPPEHRIKKEQEKAERCSAFFSE